MEGRRNAFRDDLQQFSPAFTRSSMILRSPPVNVPKQSSCQKCDEEDNNDMVMCDKCELWYHFTCVNVTASIEEKDWSCEKCKTYTSKPTSSILNIPSANSVTKPKSVKSKASKSSSAKKRQLQLQHLEEARELQRQRDETYLKQKYALLEDETSESDYENEDDHEKQRETVDKWVSEAAKSVPTFTCEQPATPSTTRALVSCTEETANVPCEYPQQIVSNLNPTILQQSTLHASTNQPTTMNSILNAQNLTTQAAPRVYPNLNYAYSQHLTPHAPVVPRNVQYGQPAQNVLYAQNPNMPANMAEGAANYFPSHDVPQLDQHTEPSSQLQPDVYHQLNRNHFAARQALPKDLIAFSGKPEDWPIFYSTFRSTTQICGYTNEENLVRLQRCLKGQALEAVRSRLLMPELVPNIIETLRMLYGRPEVLIQTLLQQIRREPGPRSDKLDTIVTYALSVQNLCATIESSGLTAHLNNPTLLQELTDKLPPQIRLNWAIFKQNITTPNISTLGNWLFELARAINNVSVSVPTDDSKEFRQRKERSFVNTHESTNNNVKTSSKTTRKCIICNNTCSNVYLCEVFKAFDYAKKWKTVKEKKLCRKCLKGHSHSRCKSDKLCGINNCQLQHHQLLHNPSKDSVTNTTSLSTCNIHRSTYQQVLFKVIPVYLHGKSSSISTYAFLDDGSSVTLIEEGLANELELSGSPDPLCLKWTANTVRVEKESRRVSMEISSSVKNSRKFKLHNVRTVKSLNLPIQSVNKATLEDQYQYLRGVPLESYSHAIPRILIGLDNWKLGLPLEVREGKWRQPIATRTRVGWIVQGFLDCTKNVSEEQHMVHSFHTCECQSNDENLHNLVREYFSIESMGVYRSEAALESKDIKHAKEIMEVTTKRIDKHFETGLLWKYKTTNLPDSYQMALKRLVCLEKKLSLNPQMLKVFEEKMAEYISKGYARRLTEIELKKSFERTWYLPIFTVTNPNKPNKVRMVWDAAAKVAGVSLNSMLLIGPDLLSPLNGVLYRFRERKVGICGDIKEMFHQIKIISRDQHAQRFLWRNGDQKRQPDVYVMQVMTFGACCSPSSAQFVKNLNAENYVKQYPRAVRAIQKNHYVDDFLDSCDTVEEAITLIKQVIHIHQNAGFEMHGFISNSKEVLKAIQRHKQSEESTLQKTHKDLDFSSEQTTEKVLGMWWCTLSDSFKFKLSTHLFRDGILSGKRKPTKREVLRILMSVFDPLGLLSYFLVFIKVLLQEIWKSGIDWDDQLTENQQSQWQSWVNLLPMVEEIEIPRCYMGSSSQQFKSIQLHIFVDASQAAFAAVAYFRIQTDTDVNCVLIGSKTRVAPQKLVSIPRLELQAAVLGVRLARSVCDQHSINFEERFFWSDSKTVISWLKSDHRRYRQFVAFRIGEVLEDSTLKEWHWVPTKLNVADEATKWTKKPEFSSNNRWFSGPDFLLQEKLYWPIDQCSTTDLVDESEEILPHLVVFEQPRQISLNFNSFSNWLRLTRTIAYVLRYISNTKAVINKRQRSFGILSQYEIQNAEQVIYREAQYDSFPDEISTIIKNNSLPIESRVQINKSSLLYKLSPYLDDHKVLRMHGRIDAVQNIEYDIKRPIILSKSHHLTMLIVMHYHRRYHHHNHETVINEIRQKYVISNLRNILKKVRATCQKCKNESAKPQPPEMGNLPAARLSPFTRPFSYVGVDYFGPMSVVVGRRTEKRWGVIFTCLTIRAIHLEIVHSLTTDSCILAIRNFISRRGTPLQFFSDNGTNFRGADTELKKEFSKMNEQKIESEITSATTIWRFIPPSSPHMGGSWERLVRSVKQNLQYVLPTRNPSDELLRGLLIEVENIVNSRPLTFIPVESSNDEALTPNHFLLGTSNGMKPSGEFTDDVLVLRKNWKISQQLCQQFWRRWLREYLPTLTRRTKWFQKVKPIEVGDIVIIMDEKNERNTYPKGIILETILGSNNQVRQATVKTSTGVYKRPAAKLAVLDVRK